MVTKCEKTERGVVGEVRGAGFVVPASVFLPFCVCVCVVSCRVFLCRHHTHCVLLLDLLKRYFIVRDGPKWYLAGTSGPSFFSGNERHHADVFVVAAWLWRCAVCTVLYCTSYVCGVCAVSCRKCMC